MKTLTNLLVLSIFTILLSCEKPKEVDDGRPRIKAISIAGISQKDIEFIPSATSSMCSFRQILPKVD